RRPDRPAEHVPEQQHEHDRLHGEGHEQLRLPRDPHQVALGDHESVDEEASHAACSSSDWSLAAWTVRVRNTSSSVGRRSATSSTPTPASPSGSTASTTLPFRSLTPSLTMFASALGGSSAIGAS